MDNRGANIDIVFRNGLKDFEVLPPPDTWSNIQPVIKTGRGSFILLKTAALIAVILTVSFFAYRLSRDISTGLDSAVMSLNQEVVTPGVSVSPYSPVKIKNKAKGRLQNSPNTIVENIAGKTSNTDNENITSPQVAFLHEINTFSTFKTSLLKGSRIPVMSSSQKNTFDIEEPDLQYLPDNSTAKHTDRWSIAAMASPTYYSKFSSVNNDNTKQMLSSEKPLISYSGGVAFTYKISKRFSVQSGLFYSSLGQEVDGINSYAGFQKYVYSKGSSNFQVLTSSGIIYTNNGDVFLSNNGSGDRIMTNYTNDVFDPKKASLPYMNSTIRQNFSYLEFPVVLRYKFVDKIIDINLIGGLSYDILVNNSAYTMFDGTKYHVGTTDGLNNISISSSIGMGMEYNFSSSLSLNLEPTFRYYLNPFNQSVTSGVHPYSFGIFSGLSYKF
jgi:hypothetical protein